MKAATFKKKYGDREFTPMEVGKAVICSLVYSRLKGTEKRAAGQSATLDDEGDTLFTRERAKAMLGTISTQEERMAYTAYRQLEEWITTRQMQNATYKTLCKSFLNSLKRTVAQIIWAEEAEAELEGIVNDERPRDAIDNNVFLHKLDAARFAFDDSEEADIYSIRDNIAYTINRIAEYNALVRLIAKEIELPELVGACEINMDDITDYIGRINGLIEEAQKAIVGRGYTADGNGIGAIKNNCFVNYLRPFDSKPRKIPAKYKTAAQQLLKGLYVFMLPSGGLTLDKTIEGR